MLQAKIICEIGGNNKNNFKKKKAIMPREIITYDGLVLRQGGFITTYGNVERMKEGGKKFTKLLDQKNMELRVSRKLRKSSWS